MPISCSPNSSNCHQGFTHRGFTLIEILVVLFIVTILAGLIVTRIPAFGSNAAFDLEARRLHMLLKMARNDAELDSTEYGFRPTDNGYEFLFFDDGKQDWVRAPSPFHPRGLDEDITLTIRADNDEAAALGESLPPVLILSSGEVTPFRMTLSSRKFADSRVLVTDGYDEIRWQEE